MSLADLHLLRPWWLLLPVLLHVLEQLVKHWSRESDAWNAHIDASLREHVLVSSKATRAASAVPFWLCLWLGGLAAAGPAWEQQPEPLLANRQPLVIALDLSRSMLAADVKPNRLERARFKIADLLGLRQDGTNALIVYAADSYVVTPLTDDRQTILQQLPVLEPKLMPNQGSRVERAYERAVALLRQAGFSQGDVLLVGDDIDEQSRQMLPARVAAEGFPVSMLGIGTAAGAPVPGLDDRSNPTVPVIARMDAALLRPAVAGLGGVFIPASSDNADVVRLAARFNRVSPIEESSEADASARRWVDRGPWLLLLLLPLFAWQLRRAHVFGCCLAFIFVPRPAEAADWDWLWQRDDERAMERLDSGDAKTAAELFGDRAWKAYAKFKAGQPDETVQLLEGREDVESIYNRGTALARLGRYPEALEVLDSALRLEPGHADARHNRDLVERAMQESQNGKGEPKQSDDGKQKPAEGSKGQEQQGQKEDQPDSGDDTQDGAAAGEPPPPEADEPGQDPQAGSEQKPPPPSPPEPDSGQQPNEETTAQDEGQRESGQATEQWLRRVPDDPGGLLRNKFLYQYRRDKRATRDKEAQDW
jgi:Ca-activated chloride channel homolog